MANQEQFVFKVEATAADSEHVLSGEHPKFVHLHQSGDFFAFQFSDSQILRPTKDSETAEILPGKGLQSSAAIQKLRQTLRERGMEIM